ncbi:MAG: BREX-2 system phosphatase PglZ [Actinobacteria bacterium]|nr:BREX-2 system phosphatase PglZ [Actinomycetota bacterium]
MTPTPASPMPVASPSVVEQYARELVRKGGTTRVLALRASPSWHGPDHVIVGGDRVLVRGCGSALAVREAMLEREPSDWLVVLTDRPSDDLGLTLLARMLHQQVEPIDVWHTVPGLFEARSAAPELRALGPWVAAALVEHRPVSGYPVAPAGVVTRDHALRMLTAAVTGLRGDELDAAGLLTWTLNQQARDAWRSQPEAVRDGIVSWSSGALGAVAEFAFRVAGSPGSVDAVTIGLAADVLWPTSGSAPESAAAARVRLEPSMGSRPISAPVAIQVAAAARGIVLRMGSDPGLSGEPINRSMILSRAQLLLGDVGWADGAVLSGVLPAGYDARLLHLASALSGSGDVEASLTALLAHDMARYERADTTMRAQMAARLHRWLAIPDLTPTDLQQALLRQARDDAWVDRAAADVWDGSTVPAVSAAYAALVGSVAARRTAHDREFASLLAEATSRDLLPADTVPLELLVARVVRPLAQAGGVLMVVVDGMSTAVAAELVDGALARGWTECVPADDRQRTAALAVLPTLTRYSRTSLFAGELRDGNQADEKRLFTDAGVGPVFHKDDLRAGAGELLPESLRQAVASASPVVAVVLNTVDDTLAKHDPGGMDWTVEAVQHLGPLLELAAVHGRTVVLTSDHGHVVHRGGESQSFEGSEARFRPVAAAAAANEVLLTGRRVLVPGSSVVAAVDEGVRYGRKAAGYHGGAAAAEVTVPVIVLARDPDPLAALGWVAAPPQAPRWWYEPVAASESSVAEPARRPKATKAPQEDTLFEGTQPVAPTGTPGERAAAALLATALFTARNAAQRRGGFDDDTVAAIVATLVDGGYRAHRDLVAAAARVPAARFQPTMAALRRLLNVEGYEVVSLDPDGVTVLLDRALLFEQFAIGGVA